MATCTQLKAIFLIFCLSFGNAAYSPLAKWVFTSDNLVDGKIKDLSAYNNDPFERDDGGLFTSSDITCSSLKVSDQKSYGMKATANSVTDSTTEFGVSVWIKVLSSDDDFQQIFYVKNKKTIDVYYLNLKWDNTITILHTISGTGTQKSSFPCKIGKWFFVVFYFILDHSNWTWNVITPEFTTKAPQTFTGVAQPGNLIAMYGLVNAYYYEIQVFQRASIDSFVVTLTTDNVFDYRATTSSCPCGDSYCHSKMGCLSTTTCQCPIYCTCPLNDGKCSSCSQGYFLYDEGTSTSCISCATSCSDCDPSPNCYECVDSVVQDKGSCKVNSIGLQISFSSPNFIVIDFAHPLSFALTISSLKATTATGADIPTTTWKIDAKSTSSQVWISTDITESKLPINIDFNFMKSS